MTESPDRSDFITEEQKEKLISLMWKGRKEGH